MLGNAWRWPTSSVPMPCLGLTAPSSGDEMGIYRSAVCEDTIQESRFPGRPVGLPWSLCHSPSCWSHQDSREHEQQGPGMRLEDTQLRTSHASHIALTPHGTGSAGTPRPLVGSPVQRRLREQSGLKGGCQGGRGGDYPMSQSLVEEALVRRAPLPLTDPCWEMPRPDDPEAPGEGDVRSTSHFPRAGLPCLP